MQDNNVNNVDVKPTPTSNQITEISNSGKKINIVENNQVTASKGTVVIGKIENNQTIVVPNQLPAQIDINKKIVEKVKKNGKKIRVVPFHERLSNFFLTIVLLGAIALGAYYGYYYLYDQNPANFTISDKTFELGEEVPNQSSYYVNLTDISDADYELDLSNIENANYKVGKYEYTVSYSSVIKVKRKAYITIEDTTKPTINKYKNLDIPANTNIKIEDIVSSCNDLSACTFKLKKDYNFSEIGTQEVIVVATDEYNNIYEEAVPINIRFDLLKYTCTKSNRSTDATHIETNTYYITTNTFGDYVNSKYEELQTYYNETDMNKIINKYKEGTYIIDKTNKTIKKITEQDNINKLSNYSEIVTYLTSEGYSCS